MSLTIIGIEPTVKRDVQLSTKGIIELIDERCITCGSRNINRNGTNPKTLERGSKIEVQRYICKDCKEDFTAPVEGYLKKHKHYRDKTIDDSLWMRFKGINLRKIGDFLEWMTGVRPTHEIIRNRINEIGERYKRKTHPTGVTFRPSAHT